MLATQERYLIDEAGKRIAVLLDIEEYEAILDAMDELAVIRAYLEAKASSAQAVPLEEAIKEIESRRTKARA